MIPVLQPVAGDDGLASGCGGVCLIALRRRPPLFALRPLGLVSMRERAEMLGGTLVIHAEPGNGTVVRATVPLAAGHNGAVRG